MTRHIFYIINNIFHPNAPSNTHCKEPISVKKLLQGDAAWYTKKVIPGWSLDTINQVFILPQHRVDAVA